MEVDIQAILGLAIVVVAMIFFITEKIPIALTALLASLSMVAIGALDLKDAYQPFGSTTTVFVAAMMVVGAALINTGIGRVAVYVSEKWHADSNPRVLLGAITLVTGVMSAFLSNSAVAAIFLPLVLTLATRARGKLNYRLMAFAVGVGAAVGGGATLTGSTSQLVAQDIFLQSDNIAPMSMFTLTLVGGPLILVSALYMATIGANIGTRILRDFAPTKSVGATGSTESGSMDPDSELPELDNLPKDNKRLIFSLAVLAIMVVGFSIGVLDIAIIALTGAAVLILAGCVPHKKVLSSIDWNTVIILAMAQAFGAGLNGSGGGQLLADGISLVLNGIDADWIVLLFMCIAAMVLTNFASNTAVAAMFIPIGIAVAESLGADLRTWAMAVTIACGIAVFTPIGTPAMTQTLVSGLRYIEYVKIGLPLALILVLITAALSPIVY